MRQKQAKVVQWEIFEAGRSYHRCSVNKGGRYSYEEAVWTVTFGFNVYTRIIIQSDRGDAVLETLDKFTRLACLCEFKGFAVVVAVNLPLGRMSLVAEYEEGEYERPAKRLKTAEREEGEDLEEGEDSDSASAGLLGDGVEEDVAGPGGEKRPHWSTSKYGSTRRVS
ncbi:hypothetical protein SKAU_G00373960 [Synaphobranchus kaupii]|uniref:Uncharacterized protein n=1 Tax=Synaphobranchus kaupii TaxID=118154 RepID=A0A9Q1IFA4_SYNKA|nr:hypothetical protein SKAU_G00373960 [Synaphobranchus kaupii]